MGLRRTLGWAGLVLATLGSALPADAVTLGRARGAVLLGRPLSVAIPITLDQGEAEPCVQAELYQGDTRSGPIDVSVASVEGGVVARLRSGVIIEEPVVTIYVRVGCTQQYTRSYVMLAEQLHDTPSAPLALAPSPVLGIVPRMSDALQVQQQTQQTQPAQQAQQQQPAPSAEAAAPLSLQSSARASVPAASAQPPRTAAPPQPQAERQAQAAAQPAPAARKKAPARPRKAAPADASSEKPAPARARPSAKPADEDGARAARPRGPRLKLEPLDLEVEQAAPLKLSPQLAPPAGSPMVVGALPNAPKAAASGSAAPEAKAASAPAIAAVSPASTPAQRAEAAAAYKALSRSPEEIAGQAQRSDAIEAEVKALREAMQRHAEATAQLAEQLEKVRSERDFASTLLAVVAALLVAGGFGMLWLRSRETSSQQARWRQMAAVPAGPVDSHVPESIVGHSSRMPVREPLSEVDSDWEGMSQIHSGGDSRDPELAVQRPKPAVASPMSEFAESQVGHSRLPKPQELIDIQQKVEFFLAIGQHERAIELLEAQIHDYLGSSPLVWLDLLELCHQFGKREDYERIREEFQHEFNARLPSFEANRPDSAGLEDHPRALSRIELLWGSPRVLKVIEESLFEDPHAPGSITFDLHASRDLLLLYSIARETVPGDLPEASPEDDYTDFIKTSLTPLPKPVLAGAAHDEAGDGEGPAAITEPVPLATLDDEDADLPPVAVGPDIDLSFITDPGAGAQALPEVEAEAAGSDPAADAPAPAPAADSNALEFDFDFEPLTRNGNRTVL